MRRQFSRVGGWMALTGVRLSQALAGVIALAFATVGYSQPPSGPDPSKNGPGRSEVATTDTEKAVTRSIMQAYLGKKLNIGNPDQEFTGSEMVLDNKNLWHARLDQVYKGIKVRGGHFNVVVQNGVVLDGDPTSISTTGTTPFSHGTYLDHDVDTNPKITSAQAIAIADKLVRDEVDRHGGPQLSNNVVDRKLLVASGKKKSTAVLEIHPGGGPGKRKLTYHVSSSDHSVTGPIQMEVWVDQEGNIAEAYNNAQTYCLTGKGNTIYQGTQGLGFGFDYFHAYDWSPPGVYILNDTCLGIGAFDMYGSTSTVYQATISNCCHPYFGDGTLGNRESSNSDAYVTTQQAYSFMYWVLGRNFVDDSGGPTVYTTPDGTTNLAAARNHYGVKYNNAFWDGSEVNIGDGDGATFQSLTALDIIGHEWHHGVTQYTAGLNYTGEAGALNESFSDIFGAMTDRYWYGESGPTGRTWKIGEEAYTPAISGDALRYMYNPSLGGQPNDYPSRYTGTADNGGVHTNSGIMNYAFYLLANGGCGTPNYPGRCVTGIGADKATQIFYRALRYYLNSSDGFYWAHQTTLWAAGDLYGYSSNAYNQVHNAWKAVGAP